MHISLQWRHNGHDSASNHQPHNCLLNRLFGCRSKKTSKPRVTGLCAGNLAGTGDFPAQMASNAEHVSIWWRHHVMGCTAYVNRYFWNKKALSPLTYWTLSTVVAKILVDIVSVLYYMELYRKFHLAINRIFSTCDGLLNNSWCRKQFCYVMSIYVE